ncbi:hypothetical protein SAMN04488123_12027 [Natribacillus halophilus]|uniref:Uncharacterized protein n=1 Tax=Natribacillus halophilus TaxID=549003 RepID=A0A1G8RU60_9BACI|nr:hypothetical protein SAMN04488123_12027 [Natribacillus halophilus]
MVRKRERNITQRFHITFYYDRGEKRGRKWNTVTTYNALKNDLEGICDQYKRIDGYIVTDNFGNPVMMKNPVRFIDTCKGLWMIITDKVGRKWTSKKSS